MVSFYYVSKSQGLTKKGLIFYCLNQRASKPKLPSLFSVTKIWKERSKVFQMECHLKWEAGRRDKGAPFLTWTLHLLLLSCFPEILGLSPPKTIPCSYTLAPPTSLP